MPGACSRPPGSASARIAAGWRIDTESMLPYGATRCDTGLGAAVSRVQSGAPAPRSTSAIGSSGRLAEVRGTGIHRSRINPSTMLRIMGQGGALGRAAARQAAAPLESKICTAWAP